MEKYCFGIDVGGTSVKCGLFREGGALEEKWEIPTHTENQGSAILPDIAGSILGKLREAGIPDEAVLGVGIGIPGPVDERGETSGAVNLNWGVKQVAREMQELTGLPCRAANDANAAALGEAWKGSAKGASHVILVTLGTGVGGGIVVDGKIVAGAHGAGGEIGHANLVPGLEETCSCGNRGCLEQVAAAPGIVRMAVAELEKGGEESLLRGGEVTAKAVFDAYKQGDRLAGRVVGRFASCLGRALAVFACVVDPEVILIGGGVSRAGEPLAEAVAGAFREAAFLACKDTPIRLAALGNDAGMYGAAKLAMLETEV